MLVYLVPFTLLRMELLITVDNTSLIDAVLVINCLVPELELVYPMKAGVVVHQFVFSMVSSLQCTYFNTV